MPSATPRPCGLRALFFGMTLVHSTPLDFKAARLDGPRPVPFEKGLFSGAGTIESPRIPATFPFDDLVGSFNADVPEGSSVELRVQVRTPGGWSSWYRLARWEGNSGRSLGEQADGTGRVDVDTLKLAVKADALRYRVVLQGKSVLRQVAVTYMDSSSAPPKPEPFVPGPWVRELALEPRSQMEEQERYKHDICSPTSLSMALEFWGKKLPTLKAAKLVQDRASGLYGNWPLNVMAAASLGLRGHVARLSGLKELEALVAQGRPVVVSIRFGEGELSGAPIRRTKGHLLVAAGFTPAGDVIAYDPAARSRREVRRVYKRAEFGRAWLSGKNGLAYVLGPRFQHPMAVGLPVADLRRTPKAPETPTPHDDARLTQLLYGERALALEAKGDWVRVEAPEQRHRVRGRWSGYSGWVRAQALTSAEGAPEPGAIVSAKRAELRIEPGGEALTLSMGSRLALRREEGGRAVLRLLDGRGASADLAALRRLDAGPPDPRRILEAAERFAGDVYVWGGLSSLHADPSWGVDCSGLAYLSYLAEGMRLPRDARPQHAASKPIRRAELAPADLVFLTRPTSLQVNHVMLYAGGDGLIESRPDRAVRTTFRERFGIPLSEIESGQTVTDASGPKPARRKIYFGSFLRP